MIDPKAGPCIAKLAIHAVSHENQCQQAGGMNCGQLVLITLNSPKEKFWGVMLALTPAGVSVRGVDLESLDDFIQMVKAGSSASAGVVFFPMHRVQRIEEDERNGDLPSLADQFRSKTGVDVMRLFGEPLS